MKRGRIQSFTDPYSPVSGQNLRFCPYTGEYGQRKPVFLHILCSDHLKMPSQFMSYVAVSTRIALPW